VFNTGTTCLVGLVPDMKKPAPEKVSIGFSQPASVYDVRSKRYLGRSAGFEVTVEPGVPCLFALVTEPVARLNLRAPTNSRLGEEIEVRYDAGIADLTSVARVQVLDPEGRELAHYGGNRDIVSGVGTAGFRTALSDPPGRWKVIVTDVISGTRAVAEVEIGR